MYRLRIAYHGLNCRIVAEIQRNVTKLDERGVISRLFHAKSDADTITAWKYDLNRILHVFNVRLTTSSLTFLTISLQTELAINTRVAVSDIRRDVANTQNIVFDIHRTMVGRHQGTDGRHRSVSSHHAVLMAEYILIIT